MNLTPLQLEIQQRADKTLSFGCLLEVQYCVGKKMIGQYVCVIRIFTYLNKLIDPSIRYRGPHKYLTERIIKNYGHPMNIGRLLYLMISNKEENATKEVQEMMEFFARSEECMQQNALERPVELQELVLKFLVTLP